MQRYSKRSFTANSPTITLSRPSDDRPRSLPIYIRSIDPIHLRAHADITGLMPTTETLLVTHHTANRRTSTLAKRIHRYSHAPYSEMIEILTRGGRNEPGIQALCKDLVDACLVCARSGQPLATKKVSFTHICEKFNQEAQADFMFVDIRNTKCCALHIVDSGTAYSETAIVSKRSV